MSDGAIAIIRWMFLASVVVSILMGTVLFDAYQRWVVRPWLALGERTGNRIHPLMRDPRVHRAWLLVGAFLTLGVWWFLGTSAGVDFLRKVGQQRR